MTETFEHWLQDSCQFPIFYQASVAVRSMDRDASQTTGFHCFQLGAGQKNIPSRNCPCFQYKSYNVELKALLSQLSEGYNRYVS